MAEEEYKIEKIMTVKNKDHEAKINSTIATLVLIQQSNHNARQF